MARRSSTRPWTRMALALAVTLAAYVAIFTQGWTPKLGLDLAGGTTVTLQPKGIDAGAPAPTEQALDQAVNIIRQRIDSLGVSESTIAKQSPFIVISVPGSSRKSILETVGRTALLTFREVDGEPVPDASVLPPAATPEPGASLQPEPGASGTPTDGAPPTGSPESAAPAPSAPASGEPASASPAASAGPTGQATPNGRPPVGVAAPAAEPSPTSSAAAPATVSAAPSVTAAPPATAEATASPAASAAASAPASPDASPAASGGPVSTTETGPLPPGTTPIVFTEEQARAAFPAFSCGVPAQRLRAADFAPDSWAFACGRDGNPVKFLLKPAGARGTDVKDANAQPETTGGGQTQVTTGNWKVTLDFKNDAFARLSDITKGGMIRTAITLDGIVQSDPVNQVRLDGPVEITGNFTQQEASDLANVLKFGALPITFSDKATSSTVSPTLGRDSLNAGLLAGLIGLAVILVYCLFYYRALSLVTVLSLLTSGLMVYAVTVLLGEAIGFTLSLAGIAGFIIGIGVTADSFVVYFERIKDELRAGRTVRSSVLAAWVPARRTTISADVVALLAAVILYAVSVGSVRGFALTLGLTTVLDLVVFFLITRPLVELLTLRRFFSTGRYSGLSTAGPQAPLRRGPIARRPSSAPLEA